MQVGALFGLIDVGAERLKRFAKVHDCIIAQADSSVVFEKGRYLAAEQPTFQPAAASACCSIATM